ncbi:MAG: hypothetical protein OXE86_04365 [Alphaproteobacteria bacterium]|nr:hypothetical protein [Alphaproteobacteria bacterium]
MHASRPDPVTCRQVTYRLLPRKTSTWRWLERVLEEQRQLYDAALQERVDCWHQEGKSLTWRDQFKSLTRCRREIPGMEDVAVAIQRGTLKRLDDAMQGFFRHTKAGLGGFPRFKGRRHWNSISIIAGVRLSGNALQIPRYGQMTVRRRDRTRARLAKTTRRCAATGPHDAQCAGGPPGNPAGMPAPGQAGKSPPSAAQPCAACPGGTRCCAVPAACPVFGSCAGQVPEARSSNEAWFMRLSML